LRWAQRNKTRDDANLISDVGLLSAWHTVAAAPWTLPAGIKTLEVNGYPMSFFESGTGATVVLVHVGGSDYPVTCADLAGLRMPVSLMQGEKTSRRLASIVDATHKCLPSAERATIPAAGHGMNVMNPAGFEKMLVEFLSR